MKHLDTNAETVKICKLASEEFEISLRLKTSPACNFANVLTTAQN